MHARLVLFALPLIALAGCEGLQHDPEEPATAAAAGSVAESPGTAPRLARPALTHAAANGAPMARPAAARPDAYDQSTAAERAAATATPAAAAQRLGTTVVTLGDPAAQGFWLRTPLVRVPGKGRLVDPASGRSVNVDLIPRPGPETGGSQISLAAMQMLGLPLTALPRLEVLARD